MDVTRTDGASQPDGTNGSAYPTGRDGAARPDQLTGTNGAAGTSWRTNIRYDLPASLVVFLIAIPLSLGIAAASGAPLMAGIVSAVVGGIVAGALGGSRLQVTGPAAGLTVIVAGAIAEFGWHGTTAIVAMAGVVQAALGMSRFGRAALTLSPAVVHGMLAGIGVVIALSQVHVVLGGAPQSSAWANLRDLPAQLIGHHEPAVAVGMITIVVLLLWPRFVRVSFLPGALIAVVASTAVATLCGLELPRVDLPDDPVAALMLPTWPDGSASAIAVAVLTIALVASVESLLSAVAIDKLHGGRPANLDRELIAQGVANTASGMLGGLPVTGVIVRSSANVSAGARTRLSAVLHGVWVALAVLFLASTLELIPMSTLAAVLVVVGVRLVSIAHIRAFLRHRELPTYLVTAVGVVLLDLLLGVLAGMAVAFLAALYRLAHCRVTVQRHDPDSDDPETGAAAVERWRVQITGTLLFLGVGRLIGTLRALPPGQHVTVDLHLDFLDHAAFEAIEEWRQAYQRQGGQVVIEESHDTWFDRAAFGRLGGVKSLPPPLPRWFAPWSRWRDTTMTASSAASREATQVITGDPVLSGLDEYERTLAPLVRPLMADLARNGQRPSQLFITCADSRLVPHVITATGPGDLFCVRNVGNIVPAYGSGADHSVGAAVEYAVDVLRVRTITVCGHSGCGAVQAMLEDSASEGSALREWLRQAGVEPHAAVLDERSIPLLAPGRDRLARCEAERLCLANVTRQLVNLRTYPSVRRALRAERLQLLGMYFDLAEARMYRIPANGASRHPAVAHSFDHGSLDHGVVNRRYEGPKFMVKEGGCAVVEGSGTVSG